MGKFFDMESPFMRFLNRVADLMILNLLMIVCCIPVITIGAAFTGMHYVLIKMVRGEEGYLLKGFFKSFIRNFKQATILWLLMLIVLAVYVGDFMIFSYSGLKFPTPLVIAVLAIAVFIMMVAMYIFPLLARFDNTVKNTIKNAFFIAVLNLPKTIIMVIVGIIPVAILYFWSYGAIFVMMFGISLPAYIAACLYSEIFRKFEPEEDKPVSDYDFSIEVSEEQGDNEPQKIE